MDVVLELILNFVKLYFWFFFLIAILGAGMLVVIFLIKAVEFINHFVHNPD